MTSSFLFYSNIYALVTISCNQFSLLESIIFSFALPFCHVLVYFDTRPLCVVLRVPTFERGCLVMWLLGTGAIGTVSQELTADTV